MEQKLKSLSLPRNNKITSYKSAQNLRSTHQMKTAISQKNWHQKEQKNLGIQVVFIFSKKKLFFCKFIEKIVGCVTFDADLVHRVNRYFPIKLLFHK